MKLAKYSVHGKIDLMASARV